ncbi:MULTISPECIES: hypothetical protein [Chromobacteriaceae]|uniref:Uncharacterized protein n=2 Tax=Chromobacteriaceae TaxID=1499392 RepID=A0ABV0CKE1_9NEIS|nr:hypothetical protein [Pseudogulbenkiania ferrooxidans]ERD99705.1 hypothetical protein O166_16655 [Pseudogulbenkiania ferrooxidans EGD-HP2]
MKKIQAVLKDIAQKSLLLASLIDEAIRVGALTQERANDLVQGLSVRGQLASSLETMLYWTADDIGDPAVIEEFQELAVCTRDYLYWVEDTVCQIRATLRNAVDCIER